MDHRTDGDAGKREAVADMNFGFRTAHNLLADLKAFRSDDVALLTVLIADQGDVGGAVRIVLDRLHRSLDAILGISLEVDDPVLASGSASAMTAGDLTLVVASGRLFQADDQRTLRLFGRDLGEIRAGHMPPGRRIRLICLNTHCVNLLIITLSAYM